MSGKKLSTALNTFLFHLILCVLVFFFYILKEIAALKSGENLIMSPLSAEIVLALLSLGAGGNTLTELNTALYLPNLEFVCVGI